MILPPGIMGAKRDHHNIYACDMWAEGGVVLHKRTMQLPQEHGKGTGGSSKTLWAQCGICHPGVIQ